MNKSCFFEAFRVISDEEIESGIEIRWAGSYRHQSEYRLERTHHRYMIFYVHEGTCKIKNENGTKTFQAGSIFFFKPFEPQIIYSPDNKWLGFSATCFSGDLIDRIIRSSSLCTWSRAQIGINERTPSLINDLAKEIIIEKDHFTLLSTLLKLLSYINSKLTTVESAMADDILFRLANAINYMKINYNKKLTIDEIAERANYSVSRFQYLIKKHYHISTSDFLINERIVKAKEILKGSNMSIGDIGYSVGFNDQFYFSKMFKKRVGMSPVEYRKYG